MKIRLGVSGFHIALLGVFLAGTSAQAAQNYYIIRNTLTNKCSIVDELPKVTTSVSNIVVQNSVAYTNKAEAEAALKGVQVCNDMQPPSDEKSARRAPAN